MDAQKPNPHVLPLELYLKVAGALLVLTVITVGVAQFDLGGFNLVVAMLIAGIKATLVALFFMHLKYADKLYAVILVGALLMVAAFITFTMFDTLERGRVYKIKATPIDRQGVIYEPTRPIDTAADSNTARDSVISELDKQP